MLYLAMIVIALASMPAAWADEPIYKCEDGMFTNRVELLCQPYESRGKVLILTQGMSVASARALMGGPSSLGETGQKVNLSDPANVCNLYKAGGVTFHLTQDVARWVALARIFPAGVPPQNCQ